MASWAEVGGRVRYWRRTRGLSQEALAEPLHVERSLISHIERGRVGLTAERAHALDRRLDTGGELADLVERALLAQIAGELGVDMRAFTAERGRTYGEGSESGGEEVDPMRRREYLAGMSVVALGIDGAEPGRVGQDDVRAIHETLDHLAARRDRLGGGAVGDQARRVLAATLHKLERGSYTATVRAELACAASRTAHFVGALAREAGDHDGIRRFFGESIALAGLAGEAGAGYVAWAHNSMARQCMDLGNGRTAIHHARAGQNVARRMRDPLMESMCAVNEAQGHALLGDIGAWRDAYARAMRAHERGRSRRESPWAAIFDDTMLVRRLGLSHLYARRYAEAEAHLAHSPAGTSESLRPRTEWTLLRAQALAGGGEVEEACAATEAALPGVSELASARVHRQLRAVCGILRPHREVPAVRDLLDQSRTALAPA